MPDRSSRAVALLPVALLAFAACSTDGPRAPGLADSLFVEAVVSVHLADARADQTGVPRDSLRAVALAAHDLDTAAFARALDYYAAHPDSLAPLYDRALDRLLDERRDVLR